MSGFGGSGAQIPGIGGAGAGILGAAAGGVISRAWVELAVDNSKALAGMAQTRAAVTRNAAAMSKAQAASMAAVQAAQMTGAQRVASAWGKASTSMIASGQRTMRTGVQLTRRITVPIALIGATATKMALDFDTAMTRIEALGGKAGMSMDDLRSRVMSLSEETAIAPTELANALYFVSSAGLKGADVMKVLEASARGAMAGMGDVGTMGQTVTSALNAYHAAGLDVTQVMNVMSEAIRQGKAEPEEFAQSLGMVMPVAAKLGVSFDQVVGAIANATNYGAEFSRSVTGMRYLLATIRNPTEEAKNILDDYGLSIGDVQTMLASPGTGLLDTLQFLSDRFDQTTPKGREAFATFTGGARGAVIADTMLGENLKRTEGIMDATAAAMEEGSDSFEHAQEAMRARPAFDFARAMNELRRGMIELGNAIIPVLTNDILPMLQGWLEAFVALPGPVKTLIVQFGLLLALIGPAGMLFGGVKVLGGLVLGLASNLLTLATSAGTATTALTALQAAQSGLKVTNVATTAAGTAAAAVPATRMFAVGEAGAATTEVIALETAAGAAAGKVAALLAGVAALGYTVSGALSTFNDATDSTSELADKYGLTAQMVQSLRDQFAAGAMELNVFSNDEDKVAEATERYKNVLRDAEAAGMDVNEAQRLLNAGWGTALEKIGGLTGSMPAFEQQLRSLVGLAPSPEMEDFVSFLEGFEGLPDVEPKTQGAFEGFDTGAFAPGDYPLNDELQESLDIVKLIEAAAPVPFEGIEKGSREASLAQSAYNRQLQTFLEHVNGAVEGGAGLANVTNELGRVYDDVNLPFGTFVETIRQVAGLAQNPERFVKRVQPLIDSLTEDLAAGEIHWDQYVRAVEAVGAKVPFRDLHEAGRLILEADHATRRQRESMADSVRTWQDFGDAADGAQVKLSRLDSQLIAADLETGNLSSAQRRLNNAFKRTVNEGLDEYGKKLRKSEVAAVGAAMKAGDYDRAVRILNRSIEKFDERKAEAKMTSDTKDAEEGIKKVSAAAEKLARKRFKVQVDMPKGKDMTIDVRQERVMREMQDVRSDLSNLETITAKPTIDANDRPFRSKVKAAEGYKPKTVDVPVDANTSPFQSAVSAIVGKTVGTAYINIVGKGGPTPTDTHHGGGLVAHSGRFLPGAGEVLVRALRGEFITNRHATRRDRRALEAINRGDRTAAIDALSRRGGLRTFRGTGVEQAQENGFRDLVRTLQRAGGRADSMTVIVQLDSDRIAAAVHKKDLRRGKVG